MKTMTRMMTMTLSGDIEWFDDYDDDDIEYPILPCIDSIWSPAGGRNKLMLDKPCGRWYT